MKRKTLQNVVLAALVLVTTLAIGSCDSFGLYELLDPDNQLTLVPGDSIVAIGDTQTFTAQGGLPGYAYSLRQPAEGIITEDGVYTAPTFAWRDIVIVSDGRKATADAIVDVIDTSGPGPLTISPTSLTININDSYTFSASGGVTPYAFGKTGAGTVNATSGQYNAPAITGTAVVTVTDDEGTSTSANVTVVDSSQPLVLQPNPARVTEGGSLQFNASGGLPPYTYSKTSGSGSVSGDTYTAPDAVGNDIATIEVADSTGPTAETDDVTVTVVPAAPTGLNVDGFYGGPKDIRLTWNDVSGHESGYIIERKGGGVVSYQQIATVGAGTDSYNDLGGLTPNTLYGYRVRAYAAGSPTLYSAYSNEAFDLSNP